MAKQTKAEKAVQAEAIASLRGLLSPGSKLYTVLNHVSASGMTRHISVFYAEANGSKADVVNITYGVGRALGLNRNSKTGGLVVGGCGMDMGFHISYNLGRALFPDGGPLECSPRKYQELRDGKTKETDGGYLLKHQWL